MVIHQAPHKTENPCCVITAGMLLLAVLSVSCTPCLLQATFNAARTVPRHPTKLGVTAMSCVPILPDFEAWANKYVIVQFPEGDPANDSKTLAKVRQIITVTPTQRA
jgi:hypothetical protein